MVAHQDITGMHHNNAMYCKMTGRMSFTCHMSFIMKYVLVLNFCPLERLKTTFLVLQWAANGNSFQGALWGMWGFSAPVSLLLTKLLKIGCVALETNLK